MKSIFLLCALSLRPISFPPIHDDVLFDRFSSEMMKAHLKPGEELWFVKGHDLPAYEFKCIEGIKFRNYKIYIRKAA